MRFSIIIPVYNVEKYIRRCMDSIMNQTFRDFEVIVVDDESPDNSMQIVEEFAKAYPGMITMIHQKNTRQGGARNRGVREAKGEYILFVDSDDYVSLNMLEFLDSQLQENPCDMLVFQFEKVSMEGRPLGVGGCGELAPGSYYPEKDKEILRIPASPANKVFRREFYMNSKVEFPEKLLYEDVIMRALYVKAAKIVVSNEILYYYVQSSNSSIRQKPSPKMLDILTMSDIVLDRFREDGMYDAFREALEASQIGSIIYILDVVNEADPRSTLQDTMMDYIASKFPGCADNPFMDIDIRESWELLSSRQFMRYHYSVIQVRKLKNYLRKWRIFVKLNQLRKRMLSKA